MFTQEATNRLELREGTRNVLILRTLIFGRRHGQGIALRSDKRPKKSCWWNAELSIRPSGGSRSEVGSPPNGELPQITGRRGLIP